MKILEKGVFSNQKYISEPNFYFFFQKIEFLQSKTTQKNTFSRGIEKSANIGHKNKGQSLGGQKKQKKMYFWQKKGIFYTKKLFLNPIFNFFQKIELLQRKTTQKNTFSRGIKKSANIAQKNKGQSLAWQKRVKKGLFF